MEKNEQYWSFFELTGNIEAYLLYKNLLVYSDSICVDVYNVDTESNVQIVGAAT